MEVDAPGGHRRQDEGQRQRALLEKRSRSTSTIAAVGTPATVREANANQGGSRQSPDMPNARSRTQE
jgi:hypothetical protein